MPLTTAQQVRNRSSDPFRWDNEAIVADGMNSTFKLRQGAPYSTLSASSYTAYVSGTGGWSATGATFDPDLGLVSFSAAPSANIVINTTYLWSIFSEDQMALFTAKGGVIDAALEAVKFLFFDYAKRARWSSPDGTSHDDSAALDNLMKTREALLDEIRGREIGPQGYFENSAESQQDFF